jgi:serine/threonine protein kinase
MSNLSPEQWLFLSPHLDRALEMNVEELSAWLSALRAEASTLAHQVEMLLQEHRELSDQGFLERISVEFPGAADRAGQTLGVYSLVSQIGHGGMGSVWLAERNDGRFERRVAVKFLHMASMGKGGEERFKREGQILGLLRHPNIAELIDAGVSPAGQSYLILEYIEGVHLDRYCDQRRLDICARVRLFLDVARTVAHAHSNHVVHRDLKPANILVRTDGQVKLLDFGIAKQLGRENRTGQSVPSRETGRAMTPEFAGPEQLKGDPVTTATDVYALGVLLYLLLTGRHPAGPGPHTPASLMKSTLETEPPRASEMAAPDMAGDAISATNASNRGTTPGKLSRFLRGDLDAIVAKALKKDPQERYASARALAEDLNRYLRLEPIAARPDSLAYRTGKFVHRHRSRVTAALLASVALIGAAADSPQMGLHRKNARGGAVERLFDAGGLVEFSCANRAANICVIGRTSAGEHALVIEAFDPLGDRRKELVRMPLAANSSADFGFDYSWRLSPDGSQLGIMKRHGSEIRLVSLRGGQMRSIKLKVYHDLLDLNWAADSQSLFVSALEPSGASLLHVSLNGDAQPIWHHGQSTPAWGIPSPDGRHRAIPRTSTEANAWVIRKF